MKDDQGPQVVTLELTNPVSFTQFQLGQRDGSGYNPKDWTLEGQAADGSWTILYTATDFNFESDMQIKTLDATAPAEGITGLRISVTANQGSSAVCYDAFAILDADGTPQDWSTIGTVITDTGNWENGDYPGSAAIRGDGCFDGPCEVPNLAGIESATDAATNTGYTTSFTSTGGELGFTTYWQVCT